MDSLFLPVMQLAAMEEDTKMSSKVNYGKYRVNTDGLIFRVDGYSSRSHSHNTENWKDLTASGLDVKLENSGLFHLLLSLANYHHPLHRLQLLNLLS